ncbi:hypothetical protein D9758_001385 [Tetrapyrgos nigripes]|uniref:Uncharacterized protein n=1 Tax=Tetrapyrgos nigripes TaxID=182062 RepID=A0A8H5GRV5_9AGAR|nr:hypothetical protein D9758_001385 [Tetrapyrgos nigripes]
MLAHRALHWTTGPQEVLSIPVRALDYSSLQQAFDEIVDLSTSSSGDSGFDVGFGFDKTSSIPSGGLSCAIQALYIMLVNVIWKGNKPQKPSGSIQVCTEYISLGYRPRNAGIYQPRSMFYGPLREPVSSNETKRS